MDYTQPGTSDRQSAIDVRNFRNVTRWRCLMAWRDHTLSNAMPRDPRNEEQRLAGRLLHVKRAVMRGWLSERTARA